MFNQIIQKQIELNDKITPTWRDQDWELAIITECAEAIDSCAWKWWKAGTDDIDNLKVEAIDLLHFVISYGLSRINGVAEQLSEVMFEEWEAAQDNMSDNRLASKTDFIKHLLSGAVAYHESPSIRFSKMSYWLFALLLNLEMNSHEVRALYMTKNLLNEYRQARGYKDPNGGYRKTINGQEDNVHFLAIIKEIGVDAPDLKALAFAKMDGIPSYD